MHAHVGEVGVVGAGHLEEGMILLPLPLDREQHVVGIEIAGRLEVRGVDATSRAAQVKV
jgi:hypothetical protein